MGYSGAGVPLWTNRFNGSGNGEDYPRALVVDRGGNVAVTGRSWNGSAYDYTTIKYSSSVGAYLNMITIGKDLVLSWTNAGFDLQSAASISGVFTNVPGATSPYTNPISDSQHYFRLAAP